MNSQRGKASTKASASSNGRQVAKSKTNGNKSAPRSQVRKNGPKVQQVQAASAYATTQRTGEAQILRTSVNSCRIVHRELVSSLVGSVNFTVASTLAINPGQSNTFPWLATQALGWEKYRFNYLRVCSFTRTGSTTPGSIILSPDYDASDAAPVSETVASAAYGTVEDAPWKDMCLDMDRARLREERFVRTGSLAANQDIKLYDVANVNICTIDGTAVAWSKIWIEYDVVLMNPQLPPGGPQGNGTLTAATTITAANPFGTAPVSTGSFALTGASTNVLSWSGLSLGTEYVLSFHATGTTISSFTSSATSGMNVKNILFAGFPAAATSASYTITFTPSATSGSFTLGVTAATLTANYVTLNALTPAPSF